MRRLLTGHFGLVKPQMVLCGATLTQEHLEEVGSLGVLASPQLVGMGGGEVLPGSIEHLYAVVDAPRKLMTLARLLKKDLTDSGMDDAPPRVMVFASSDEQARQIADPLRTSLWGQHKLSVLLPTGFETVSAQLLVNPQSPLPLATPVACLGVHSMTIPFPLISIDPHLHCHPPHCFTATTLPSTPPSLSHHLPPLHPSLPSPPPPRCAKWRHSATTVPRSWCAPRRPRGASTCRP